MPDHEGEVAEPRNSSTKPTKGWKAILGPKREHERAPLLSMRVGATRKRERAQEKTYVTAAPVALSVWASQSP